MNNETNELPCTSTASTAHIPVHFIGDDATSADQIALAIVQILGKKVITTDAWSLSQSSPSIEKGSVRVINSGTRALPAEKAHAQNHFLATRIFRGVENIPVLQIDSRLRGIGNALRGIYESCDFDYLLFVPAEP